jgi:hypothetical protein
MEDVGIFNGHLVIFTDNLMSIWCILWSFSNFSSFGRLYQEKSGNPVLKQKIVNFTQQDCFVFPTKTSTPAGFELGSSVPEADAMPLLHVYSEKKEFPDFFATLHKNVENWGEEARRKLTFQIS